LEKEWLSKDDYMAELVQKYADTVLRIALTYLKNIADAQDVCQDVYVKIFKYDNGFNDMEHEKAWIIRVTINTCKDVLRNPWRWRYLPINEAISYIQHEDNKEVVAVVLELARKYRMVIYLYYFENFSTAEIGKMLKINENTVRTQLKRARKLLQTKMIGGCEDEKIYRWNE
jgi:RNA polymerase sigma factor (sigma-70 family)